MGGGGLCSKSPQSPAIGSYPNWRWMISWVGVSEQWAPTLTEVDDEWGGSEAAM